MDVLLNKLSLNALGCNHSPQEILNDLKSSGTGEDESSIVESLHEEKKEEKIIRSPAATPAPVKLVQAELVQREQPQSLCRVGGEGDSRRETTKGTGDFILDFADDQDFAD